MPNESRQWTNAQPYKRDPSASLPSRQAMAHEMAAERATTQRKKMQHLTSAKILRSQTTE